MSLAAVDFLARLQLEARRLGVELQLRDVAPRMQELIALAGLEETLGLEPSRKTDEREQRVDLEEEGQLGDALG